MHKQYCKYQATGIVKCIYRVVPKGQPECLSVMVVQREKGEMLD